MPVASPSFLLPSIICLIIITLQNAQVVVLYFFFSLYLAVEDFICRDFHCQTGKRASQETESVDKNYSVCILVFCCSITTASNNRHLVSHRSVGQKSRHRVAGSLDQKSHKAEIKVSDSCVLICSSGVPASLMQAFGRIHFLEVVGLRCPLSCQLLAGSCSQL